MSISVAAAPGLHFRWTPPGRYDLLRTIGILQCGPHDPAFLLDGRGAWLAFRTGAGPVTVLLRQHGGLAAAKVLGTVWGPGAEAALTTLPALLGASDDWTDFDDAGFQASLPPLVRTGRRLNPGLRLPSSGRMLDAVIRVILEQRVTGIEAKRAWRYLLTRFGDPAPAAGESAPAGLRLPPTAAQWRRIPSWEWHRAGVDAHRSAAALRAASAASGLERLAGLDAGPELAAKLRSVSGIGVWTAAEVAQRTHGDPDSVSVGDFHLASFVGYALTGRKTDDAGMLRLLEPWTGQRQRVVRMLYSSSFRKPAFGPRLAPSDHRRR